MFYTKEMIHKEFESATHADKRTAGKPANVKEVFTQRIKYLKQLKEDMIKSPKYFRDVKITPDQLQNTINCYLAPNPRDAFYKSVFGMTYAEKKAQEEMEYFIYENGEKKEVRKSKETTQSIH